jgi:hypothetical protein
MPVPDFSPGEILTAGAMDSIGLWKVASGTLSLTTSYSNVTGVFSGDYKNYRVLLNITARSTSNRFDMRYLVGTTPVTTNGYYQGGIGSDYGSNTTAYFQRSNNDGNFFFDNTTGTASYSIDIMSPQLNTPTRHYGQTSQVANPLSYAFGGAQVGNNQVTGFQLMAHVGTMTVEYQVFGYRN